MILTKCKTDAVDIDILIEQKILDGKLNELLMIVPTNRKIRALKRELISLAPGKALSILNLETIGTFSTKILFGDEKNRWRVLGEAASTILIKQSFNESKLNYFSNYNGEIPSGTLNRIKNVISEYKKNGVTPSLLLSEAESLASSEKLKAIDIAMIYDVYNEKCRTLNVKEIGDIYFGINSIQQPGFNENVKELFPDINLVIINGFDEFTLPEVEIIDKLSKYERAELYISFDYYSYNPLIFSHLDKCYDSLKNKGFFEIKDSSPLVSDKFGSLMKEKLFSSVAGGIPDFKDQITLLTALNREREIEAIAKEAKILITEKNVKPNKICVVFNLIQNYSSLVRDIFKIYGLPFNLTDRLSLKTSPPVIAVINFLEILENDFYYKNIFRALSSGFLEFPEISRSNLLKTSVNLKITAGYENWLNSLEQAILRCDNGDEDSVAVFLDKEMYEKALLDIKSLYKHLEPFNVQLNISEFVDRLKDLIYSINLPGRLINDRGFSLEENIKAVSSFLEEIKEVFELLGAEYNNNKKFPLHFYLNNLRTMAGSSRYNVKERPGYGIQVTTLNEIRGLKFDYLFIAGLCDGDLPTKYSPEIFFSGTYAKNEKNHLTGERYHFYQSLCSWNNHLYLSYPAQEDRKELVSSGFLSEFNALIEFEKKDEKDFGETIFSKEEFLINIGREGVEKSRTLYSDGDTGIDFNIIEKSLAIDRIRRKDPFGKSEYTGYINLNLSEKAKDIINEYSDKQYSISQLEIYAKCPYKYFAERILKLKPLSEPAEDIEALEMGSLLHTILYKFYSNARESGIILSACSNDEFKAAQELLFKIAEDVIEKAGFNSPLTFFEKEKILGINKNRKDSILFNFLTAERENKDGYVPEFFEISFGDLPDGSKNNIQMKAGKYSVRGKIDRIDIKNSSQKFKVIDYKLSGKKPTKSELYNGLSLQLPLYMYAAKLLIKKQIEKDYLPSGAEIYSLKFKQDDFGKKLATEWSRKKISEDEKEKIASEMNEELIELCLRVIEKYVDEIVEGKFNLSTLADREKVVCMYCDFRPICRIQAAD